MVARTRWKTARAATWRICPSLDCLRYSLVCSRSRRYLQTKKQTVDEGSAVNCPASLGKYAPIDGRKYTGKFYSQNRSPGGGGDGRTLSVTGKH